MSDAPQGPGWWQASDGRWYPPQGAATAPLAAPPAVPPTPQAAGGAPWGAAPGPVPPPSPTPTARRTDGRAIASLVLGILALFLIPIIGSVAAIVLGHQARGRIRRSAGGLGGDGMAVTGLILGYLSLAVAALGVLAAVAVFAVGSSGDGAQRQACRIEERTLETAAAAFYADRGVAPANSDELVGPYLEEPPRYYDFTTVDGSLRFRRIDPRCPPPRGG